MVAAARALATAEPEPIICDPFAAALVRAVGVDFFTRIVDGDAVFPEITGDDPVRLMTDAMAVRTGFFDDFFLTSATAGIRQAVILASGLDTRAYRLPWPHGTVVYELDQPDVITFKTRTLTELGAAPAADLRNVSIDLRDDWPKALRDAGFDADQRSAWSAEGLLMYLPPEAQDRLFDNITALAAPGSRVATEFHSGEFGGALSERARELFGGTGSDSPVGDFADLVYTGARSHVADYLGARGWAVTTRARTDVYADYGKVFPDSTMMAPLSDSVAITAVWQ
ncbi:MAG: SAM-dependent methyltransferase [Mycobacterium sp.]